MTDAGILWVTFDEYGLPMEVGNSPDDAWAKTSFNFLSPLAQLSSDLQKAIKQMKACGAYIKQVEVIR